MKQKSIKILKQIAKYIVFFVMFYVFFKATTIKASGFYALAFFVALMAAGQNAIYLSPFFMLAAFLSGTNVISLLLYLISLVVLIITFIIHKHLKRSYAKLTLNFVLVGALVPFVVSELSLMPALFNLLNMGLSLLFLKINFNFLVAALNRQVCLKLNTDEILSAMIFLAVFASGLHGCVFWSFPVGNILIYYIVLICSFALNNVSGLLISTSLAFGCLLGGASATCFVPIMLVCATSLIFKKSGKWFTALGALFAYAASIYFVNELNLILFSSISFALSLGLFLLTTKTFVSEFSAFVNGTSAYTPSVLSYTKASLKQKIDNTESVINLVSNVLKKNIKAEISIEDGKEILSGELINTVCKKCPNYSMCYALHNDTKTAVNNFFGAGLVRGKITLLDIPPFFVERCKNSPVILNEVNGMIQKFLKFNVMQNGANEGTIIASKQLDTVAGQLSKLSASLSDKTVFNTKLEAEVEKRLIYKNLVPTRVFCVEENGRFVFTISFKESLVNIESTIAEVVSEVLKKPASVTMLNEKTYSAIDAPMCDCIFGVATANKLESNESGDAYSFFKMTDDNALFALCDGMGSGERASEISDYALTLVESFYRAEFDKEQIYSSINKLLVMNSRDEFCALDVCVVDLFKRSFSLYKLGAPESYIKHSDSTEILNSGALPIGIVDESTPKVETRLLDFSDIVVLVSDGISDTFKNSVELKEFIERQTDTNPQALADKILEECKVRNKNALSDDSTVLAFRLFEKKK